MARTVSAVHLRLQCHSDDACRPSQLSHQWRQERHLWRQLRGWDPAVDDESGAQSVASERVVAVDRHLVATARVGGGRSRAGALFGAPPVQGHLSDLEGVRRPQSGGHDHHSAELRLLRHERRSHPRQIPERSDRALVGDGSALGDAHAHDVAAELPATGVVGRLSSLGVQNVLRSVFNEFKTKY